ncbi:unnamed protein product [Cylindrotheca closterium]|uniref:Kinesin light chain n=1 Tax=Cylindrotheca closterium TaxID=2856 RepID=A0AAD2JN08_9STRA|nr:unnamed protein product [Cylindrotheca closterium]
MSEDNQKQSPCSMSEIGTISKIVKSANEQKDESSSEASSAAPGDDSREMHNEDSASRQQIASDEELSFAKDDGPAYVAVRDTNDHDGCDASSMVTFDSERTGAHDMRQDPIENRSLGAKSMMIATRSMTHETIQEVPDTVRDSSKEQKDGGYSEASSAAPDDDCRGAHNNEDPASRQQVAPDDELSFGMEGGRPYVRPSKEEQIRFNDELSQLLKETSSGMGWTDPEVAKICNTMTSQKFDEEQRRLWDELGHQLQAKGLMDSDDALEQYQRALEIRVKALGPEHPDTASTYNNIGVVFQNQGKYEDALEQYQRALEIRVKALGPEHPDTASTYNNMGIVFQNQGKYEDALEQYQRALEIYVKALGPEHPDTASTYHSMGIVFQNQGKYEDALEQYQRALEIRVKALGPEHPDTASTYHSMGIVFLNQGKYEDALEQYQRALEIRVKALGPEHPDTTVTCKMVEMTSEVNRSFCMKSLFFFVRILVKFHRVAMSYNSKAKVLLASIFGELSRRK